MPAVTVVMPVYNGLRKSPNYLPEAIESVLGQTFADFEFLIVDDGSTEDYSELIAKYTDTRIKWVRKENGGQSSARNYGAKMGSGKWVAFIDQDDRWYPWRLTKTVEAIETASPLCVLVYGELDRIDANGAIFYHRMLKNRSAGTHPKHSIEHVIGEDSHVLPGTMLLDRKTFLRVGGFSEDLSGFEDDQLAVRLFQIGELVFVPDPILQWRFYPESYSYGERMDRSRRRYFGWLAASFPNTPDRHCISDMVAPRFFRSWLVSIWRASFFTDRAPAIDQVKRAQAALPEIAPYLSWRHRIIGWLVWALPARFLLAIAKNPITKRLAIRLV